MGQTCLVCGRQADPQVDGDPPLAWTAERAGDDQPTLWCCPHCTRENVRSIEAKLEREWW